MTLAWIAALAAWGGFIGLTVGFTGVGTGLLGSPGLMVIFHIDPLTAVATMAVAGTCMMASGAYTHIRAGRVEKRVALAFSLTALPASFIAARYAEIINSRIPLRSLIGVLIIVSVVLMVYKFFFMDKGKEEAPRRSRIWAAPFLGLIIGLIMGATSISGSLVVLSFLLILRLPSDQAVGTTSFVSMVSLAIASFGHIQSGSVDWMLFLSLLPGIVIGSRIGAAYVGRAPQQLLRGAILVILFLAGAMILFSP